MWNLSVFKAKQAALSPPVVSSSPSSLMQSFLRAAEFIAGGGGSTAEHVLRQVAFAQSWNDQDNREFFL